MSPDRCYAWGNETSSTGDKTIGDGRLLNDANPFRYSSYYFDETSGLYYLKARYYSPELGRFLSRDPVPNGPNAYTYCGNDPVRLIDEGGTFPWLERIAAGGAAALSMLGNSIGAATLGPALLVTGAILLGVALLGAAVDAIDAGIDRAKSSSGKGTQPSVTHFPNSSVQGPPPPPKKPKWEKDREGHVFQEHHHLENTPEAQRLIQEAADPANYIGTDGFGEQIFASAWGTYQVWVRLSSDGVIKSGGLNLVKSIQTPNSIVSVPYSMPFVKSRGFAQSCVSRN